MPKFTFDSVQEVRDFVKNDLKGARGAKLADDATDQSNPGQAPAPIMPPTGGMQAGGFPGTGFAPQAGGAGPMGAGFPALGAQTGPSPEIVALVSRIVTKCEAAVNSGVAKVDDMLGWFRSQCGPGSEQATWDQIKTISLPRLTMPALENIAKAMNA